MTVRAVTRLDNKAAHLSKNTFRFFIATYTKKCGKIQLVCPPAATYQRVPHLPLLPERFLRLQRAFFRGYMVNLFKATDYRFILFPRNEPQTVAYNVYDTPK